MPSLLGTATGGGRCPAELPGRSRDRGGGAGLDRGGSLFDDLEPKSPTVADEGMPFDKTRDRGAAEDAEDSAGDGGIGGISGTGERLRLGTGIDSVGAGERERTGVDAGVCICSDDLREARGRYTGGAALGLPSGFSTSNRSSRNRKSRPYSSSSCICRTQ